MACCAATVELERKPEKMTEANGEKVRPAVAAVDNGLRAKAKKKTGNDIMVDDAMKRNAGLRRTGDELKAEPCRVEDKDFVAEFDGMKWVVEWVWKGEMPVLKNRVGCYEHALQGRVTEKFDREVDM